MNVGGTTADPVSKYRSPYAGEDNGGVVVCGVENEVAPDPMEAVDYFAATNRKLESRDIVSNVSNKRLIICFATLGSISVAFTHLSFPTTCPFFSQDYNGQKRTTWADIILSAPDQLCQKMGWALNKIFATSTGANSDSPNSETNIQIHDNFIMSCPSTYKEVIKRVSFNEEMANQLTFLRNKVT